MGPEDDWQSPFQTREARPFPAEPSESFQIHGSTMPLENTVRHESSENLLSCTVVYNVLSVKGVNDQIDIWSRLIKNNCW